MTDEIIQSKFEKLYFDIDCYPQQKPLLAHYTTIGTLDNILRNNQLWFSNPLFMNDLEELRTVIKEAYDLILENKEIEKACNTLDRFNQLCRLYEDYYDKYSSEEALDIYVFCTSLHEKDDSDGLLSMWRGYGGNGTGAAIVIDTSKFGEPQEDAFMILAEVKYLKPEERLQKLKEKLLEFASILADEFIPDDKLYIAAHALFDRLILFALFTKHKGFYEEREWRAVYTKSRDKHKRCESMMSYLVHNDTVQPKLKLDVDVLGRVESGGVKFEDTIDKIILGPCSTNGKLLQLKTVQRMLGIINPKISDKIFISSIPYRRL